MNMAPGTPRLAHLKNSQTYSVIVDTLVDLLTLRSQEQREALILMDLQNEAHPVKAADILANAQIAAQFLMNKGLKKGEKVVLMLPTSREFLYLFFGILMAGGVPVPISQPTGPDHQEKHLAHVKHIIHDCEAKFFIIFNRMEIIIGGSENLATVCADVILADDIFHQTASNRHANPYPPILADDAALIQYTSGTTSRPKGVVLSHKNILHNIHAIGVAGAMSENDTSISWLPLYHDMGLTGALLTAIYWKIRLILMRPEAFIFKPQWWLQNISRFKANISVAPNFGYHYSATRIADSEMVAIDLRSWRIALNGAEPIDWMTLNKFYAKFERYGLRPNLFLPVYGMAENSLAATFPALDQPTVVQRFDRARMQADHIAADSSSEDSKAYIDLVSVGYPILGQEVRIADDQDRTLSERQIGQILIKSPSLTQGYHNNIDATRQAIREGWLRTGDLGFILEGRLYIAGRIKEMIIKRGKNIYPYDVERMAATVDGVRLGSCAAFSAENEAAGTEDIVLVCESIIADTDAIAALKKMIENTILKSLGLRPDRIVITAKGAVPKTTSGKIRRIACKQMYLDGTLNQKEAGRDIPIADRPPLSASR